MGPVLASVSDREIASAFWLGILAVVIILNPGTREAAARVMGQFLQPMLLMPLLTATVYASAEIYGLRLIGWWSVANLKTTALWLVTFAFVTMFEVASAQNGSADLRKVAKDLFSATAVLLFIAELQSFPLLVELIALPAATFIACLDVVAKHEPEHVPVAKLTGCITALLGLSYLGFSIWRTVQAWGETATAQTALEFAVPIILSLGFLPFLYFWRAYVAYDSAFTAISVVGLDASLVPYARRLALTRVRGDLDMLDRWRRAIMQTRPTSKRELKHSLTALLALKAREASPPVVQADDGWSPYLAMQFMADLGVDTGHYHQSFGDEWFASSPMKELGASPGLRDNIAYYIEGTEHAATALKVKLNVNVPSDRVEAEDTFVVHAAHLLEQAVSLDAVERLKSQIASLSHFEAPIPFGSVSLKREDFSGGIEGGYSRIFQVQRGARPQ